MPGREAALGLAARHSSLKLITPGALVRLTRGRWRVVTHLWVTSALSSGSTWTMQVGLFVYVLQSAPISTLAIVELIGTVPTLLAMPLAGVLADRVDPRKLAIISMFAQTLCVAGMALLLSTDLWLVATLYALQGVSNTVWPTARQQWLYLLVAPKGRANANSALGSIGGLTTILGAGLGGVLSAWNPLGAMIIAVVLQALAIPPLLQLAKNPLTYIEDGQHFSGARHQQSLRRQLADGLRVLRKVPLARSVVWIGIAWGCIGGAYNVLLAGYVITDLRGSGTLLGGFYAVAGIAVILGTALTTRILTKHHLPAYALGYVVQGAAWAGMFLSSNAMVAVVVLALMRLASGVIIALDTTILLAAVPAGLRGRVTSLHMTTYSAMARVSLALSGLLLTVIDIRPLGVLAGLCSVLVGLVWWGLRTARPRATTSP